jgi:hypothetical protein
MITARRMSAETNKDRRRKNLKLQGLTPEIKFQGLTLEIED